MSTSIDAPDLELLSTDVEDDLRATVRDLLADRCPPEAVVAMYDGDRSIAGRLWGSLAGDLGLAGLLVPDELGGAGASALEAATVLEELGRSCAPAPFLTSAVVATTVLLGCDHRSARDALSALATGGRTAALVVPWSTGPDDRLVDGSATIRNVAGALEADLLLVAVPSDRGVTLRLVDSSDATIDPVVSLDMSRQVADVTVDRAAGEEVSPDAEDAIRRALLVGTGLLSSEQVGVARWCLEQTVDYLKVRRQFGRVVGGFQAVKHRLADLYAQVESSAATARHAAAAVAAGQDVDIASRVAAAYCGDIAVHASEEAVQLHGGIGMTWEHPAHLYMKRAKSDQIALGVAEVHRAALAALVDLTIDGSGA